MILQITPQLLNFFDAYNRAPAGHKARVLQSIRSIITREEQAKTPFLEKGDVFKRDVYNYLCSRLTGGNKAGVSTAVKVCGDYCINEGSGSLSMQSWVPRLSYMADGHEYRLVGFVDVKRDNLLVNIHTTPMRIHDSQFPDGIKKGWMGPLFCLATGIPRLDTFVAVWDDASNLDSMAIAETHVHTYRLGSREDVIENLIQKTEEFSNFVTSVGLWDYYVHTYSKNRRA